MATKKQTRNAKGTGTYYYNESTKLWRYRITVDGKTKTFYGNTKTAALNKYKNYLSTNPITSKEETSELQVVILEWVKKKKITLRSSSYDNLLYVVSQINNYIGSYNMSDITSSLIQDELINALLRNETARGSIIKIRNYLKEFFD